MEDFGCPFCNFKDKDSYFLLQHVELIHPENGESPFIVKDDEPGRASSDPELTNNNHGKQDQSSAASLQDEYIDCPHRCGERVSRAELSSHTDFHMAEEMALDEALSYSSEGDLSTGPSSDAQAAEDMTKYFSTDLPKSLRNRDQLKPSTPDRNSPRRRLSLKEILLGSPGSPPSRSPVKSRKVAGDQTRRLGVSDTFPYTEKGN
jgi:hypothetical protein